jgi:hypothetical protein
LYFFKKPIHKSSVEKKNENKSDENGDEDDEKRPECTRYKFFTKFKNFN